MAYRYEDNIRAYAKTRESRLSAIAARRCEIIQSLGGQCVRCGFPDYRALQVDHINGGGNLEGKLSPILRHYNVVHDEDNKYQLLCANCNWIKRHENNEVPRRGRAK